MNTRLFFSVLSASLLGALAGCGGGGSGGITPPTTLPPVTPPPLGGIEGSGIAIGAITGFGSVIVNGVRYDTSNATITVDGEAATQDDLSVGDVVFLSTTIVSGATTGTALSVSLDHILEGPISALDAATSTFVVLGQTVVVDASTVFDNRFATPDFSGLALGERVEISGFIDGAGRVIASRVEPGDANADLEITGTVAALATGSSTFSINGQVVDYSAAVLEDFPSGGIADGQQVEVKAGGLDGNGRLSATRIEFKDELDQIDAGDELEIEGFISRFVSATDFDVAGIAVTTNGGTEYERGTAADLGLNVKVEVEGEFNANGVLVADEVKFRLSSSTRVEASVDAVSGTSLVVLGITVNVDALTSFEDDSDADLSPFSLADISAGDYVKVRGSESPAGSGELLATRIERDDPDSEVSVRGPVESAAEPTITILGVTIETDADTEFEDDGAQLTAAEFFAQVAPGDVVEVEGEEVANSTVIADKVEFEGDDD